MSEILRVGYVGVLAWCAQEGATPGGFAPVFSEVDFVNLPQYHIYL